MQSRCLRLVFTVDEPRFLRVFQQNTAFLEIVFEPGDDDPTLLFRVRDERGGTLYETELGGER